MISRDLWLISQQYTRYYKFGELWKRIINSTSTSFADTPIDWRKPTLPLTGSAVRGGGTTRRTHSEAETRKCALPYDHCVVNRGFLRMRLLAAKYHRWLYVDVNFSLSWPTMRYNIFQYLFNVNFPFRPNAALPTMIEHMYIVSFQSPIFWWSLSIFPLQKFDGSQSIRFSIWIRTQLKLFFLRLLSKSLKLPQLIC